MVRRTPRTLAAISLAALVSIATWWPGHNLPAAEAKPGSAASAARWHSRRCQGRHGAHGLRRRGRRGRPAPGSPEAVAWLRAAFPTFRDRLFKAPVQVEHWRKAPFASAC